MRLLIVTAADESYSPLLRDLVESLSQWGPLPNSELGVLDLGLGPQTLAWLRRYTDRIVRPGWDLPVSEELARTKPGLRAMTSRPFLPRHFPGYDTYLWLDADTWVQQRYALEWLVRASAGGALAIVPQIDRLYRHAASVVQWRLDHLRRYFGEVPEELLLIEPYVNSGVFALAAGAPHWGRWASWFRQGLERSGGKFATDQAALNYTLWRDRLPIYPLPSLCNWTCHLALPEYRVSDGLFHEPGIPGDPIGILHLTSKIKDATVTARFADGREVRVGIRYGASRPRGEPVGTDAR